MPALTTTRKPTLTPTPTPLCTDMAVIGCGASGLAYVDEALSLGVSVTLSAHPHHQSNLHKILDDGALDVVRHRGDDAPVKATWAVGKAGFHIADLARALRSSDYVYLAMSAQGDAHYNAHEDMIRCVIATGVDTRSKVFVAVNGHEFAWKADRCGLAYRGVVTTIASSFASRIARDDTRLTLISKGKKVWMLGGVHPRCEDTRKLANALQRHVGVTYTFTTRVEALFATTNQCLHLPILFANASRVDAKESFLFYGQGLTPSVAKMIEAYDADRFAILRALGYYAGMSSRETLNRFYGFAFPDLVSLGVGTPVHNKTAGGPPERYVSEDGRQARRWCVIARAIGVRADVVGVYATQAVVTTGRVNAESEEQILRDFGIEGCGEEEARLASLTHVGTMMATSCSSTLAALVPKVRSACAALTCGLSRSSTLRSRLWSVKRTAKAAMVGSRPMTERNSARSGRVISVRAPFSHTYTFGVSSRMPAARLRASRNCPYSLSTSVRACLAPCEGCVAWRTVASTRPASPVDEDLGQREARRRDADRSGRKQNLMTSERTRHERAHQDGDRIEAAIQRLVLADPKREVVGRERSEHNRLGFGQYAHYERYLARDEGSLAEAGEREECNGDAEDGDAREERSSCGAACEGHRRAGQDGRNVVGEVDADGVGQLEERDVLVEGPRVGVEMLQLQQCTPLVVAEGEPAGW
ncbi:hypothetical protein BDZ90DRAFT_227275 [Jaminaea rosea]|uniref:Opine dehydrogenase domain-containing protein n=1 Tax=Jaminaea rosea TaxID=1569628 RepID=A0A316UQH2_9BASI|nr:hypothetical protein BDZ90DRAFT_227275 [Jaminaea rosea]PWN27559.1 hypothetical protein BDZ90DRAFT_227275 [Jaminaea rosea]